MVDLEFLDRLEILCKLELRQHNDFVSSPCGSMGDHNEAINVAEWEKAQLDLRVNTIFLAAD